MPTFGAVLGGRPRHIHLLLCAYGVSTVGDWMFRLALPLLVLRMTGSAIGAALAYATEFAPYIVFSLLGGVAADRFDRRRLLIVSDLTSAGLVSVLAALVALDVQEVWMIFLGAFILGGVAPFYHPAFQALVPVLVDDEELARANARFQTVDSLLTLTAPVLGGSIIAALGITTALWLDGLSFALSALAIGAISTTTTSSTNRGTGLRIGRELKEALAYLRRDRVTLWASLLMGGTNIGLYLIEANLIFYVVSVLGAPVAAVGIVFGAYGAGSVLGASLAPRLSRSVAPGRLIATCMIAAGMATALFIPLSTVVGIAIVWGAIGAFVMILIVTWFTHRQRIVPSDLMGRVVALSRMISFVPIPAAAMAGAVLLEIDRSATLLIASSAAVQVGVGVMAAFTALGKANAPSAPAIRVAVASEDRGPLVGPAHGGADGSHHLEVAD